MGQSCQPQCCSIQMDILEVHHANAHRDSLELDAINILDYEQRVKKFAHPCNKSKVSISQLKSAFAGTGIFNQLGRARSVVHCLVTSPFFKNFSLKRVQQQKDFFEEMDQLYISSARGELDATSSIKVHPIISSAAVNRKKINPLTDAEQRKDQVLSKTNSNKSIRSSR